jgi:citrate lyase gamma subunit
LFDTSKIIIKGINYDVDQVQGIERKFITAVRTQVLIKVDDFKTPIHKIEIMGKGADDKFVQRLSAALRKAGGNSFY